MGDRIHTQKGSHGAGRCRKEKRKKSDHGRIAFYEHGGKSGMAMLKYPHIKKNAQPTKKVCIPRFAHRVA